LIAIKRKGGESPRINAVSQSVNSAISFEAVQDIKEGSVVLVLGVTVASLSQSK
jgi:hypothetical protein